MLKNLKKYVENINSNVLFISHVVVFFTSSDLHKGSQLCFHVCSHLKADNFLSAADGALIMSQ